MGDNQEKKDIAAKAMSYIEYLCAQSTSKVTPRDIVRLMRKVTSPRESKPEEAVTWEDFISGKSSL